MSDERWYMMARDGRATLCADRADAEHEARNADTAWPAMGPHRAVQLVEAGFDACDMATAAAQGFRDGVASLSLPAAGQEPVADAALQNFASPRAKILMRAWQEGWEACRDSEYVGEDAQNDAFNQSGTVNHCVAEDILYAAPQPAVAAGSEQIAEAALRKVLSAVQRYLPPDGPEAKDTLSEIIEIVDPWPLGLLEKP